MENQYDVIIIGAGPAGLECAYQLKNTKLSVLLLEKNKAIGPKTCGGGLTNLAANLNLPRDKTRIFPSVSAIIGNKSYTINLKNPLQTIARRDLGEFQLDRISSAANLKILKETVVETIEKDRIKTNRGVFYFKYLVGADGSNSLVRRFLGLKSKICLGLYYDLEKVTDQFIWYFNPSQLRSGYLWVFPHKNYTNVGVYFDPDKVTASAARSVLESFLKSRGEKFSNDQLKAASLNYFYQGCVFNNIFLAGDAAGLVSKPTGEGISFALASGREIARKILDPDCELVEFNKILKFKRRQERLLRLLELIPSFETILFKLFVNSMKMQWFQSFFGN